MKKFILATILATLATSAMASNFMCQMECEKNGYGYAYCKAMCQ